MSDQPMMESQDVIRLKHDLMKILTCQPGQAAVIIDNLSSEGVQQLNAEIIERRNQERDFVRAFCNEPKNQKVGTIADNQPTGDKAPTTDV